MSRRKAFTRMLHCNVIVRSGQMQIKPNRKERGETWSGKGFTEDDAGVLPFDSAPAEIGAAIRAVLDKCE